MTFGWINLFGGIFVGLMLIPNIIFAVKKRKNGSDEGMTPKHLNVFENIGRYACIVLMWLPLGVWEFGFRSNAEAAGYLMINLVLTAAYYVIWLFYAKKPSLKSGMALSVIPTAVFLLSGIFLRHWLLVAAAVIFGLAHGKITIMTHNKESEK